MPQVSVNGIGLNYEEKGEGPPLVLLHGFQNSTFAFTPIRDHLAERFRVIAIDLRGHGKSEKPKGPYTIQLFSDDLLAFLDAMELDRTHLLGHSMGGRTATLFAVEHSERLESVMVVASSAGAPSGEYRKRFEAMHRLASEEGMAAVFESREFSRLMPKEIIEGAYAAEYRERYLRNTPQTMADTAHALFTMPDLRGRLGEISVPAWVCYGENDHGPLDYRDAYRNGIPDCTLVILPGCGHFPYWEKTEEFLEALDAFLG